MSNGSQAHVASEEQRKTEQWHEAEKFQFYVPINGRMVLFSGTRVKTKKRSIWRSAQAIAMLAMHMLQAVNKTDEADKWHEPKKFKTLRVNQENNGIVKTN